MAKRDGFDKSFQLRVNDEFLEMIDNWMKERGHDWSKSEAIRTLVKMGTKISAGKHGHVNEDLQNLSRIHKNVTDRFHISADNVSTLEGCQKVAKDITLSLKEIEVIDRSLAEFAADRGMLRDQLAELRSGLITNLTSVQQTIDHHISVSRQQTSN